MSDEIRPAQPSDAAFLADVWRAMSEELGLAPQGFAPGWRGPPRRLLWGIADRSQGWFVSLRAGEPAGSAGLFRRASVIAEVQYRRPGVLVGVYVLPEHRRRGLARRLVRRAIAWGRAHGCTEISLHASAAAAALYRELGFEDDAGLILKLG